jgi:hypothetical protein
MDHTMEFSLCPFKNHRVGRHCLSLVGSQARQFLALVPSCNRASLELALDGRTCDEWVYICCHEQRNSRYYVVLVLSGIV